MTSAAQGNAADGHAAETFRGKTAVITGAANGIGEGFARHAGSLGMNVVLADLDGDRASAVADDIARASGVRTLAIATDVADESSVEALAERAWAEFGGVDMLLNNAGLMAMGYSWEIPAVKWDAMLRVNVAGQANAIRAFVPRMLDRGTQAWVVGVSSVGGMLPSPLMSPYSATKFAVLALTESLRYEMDMKGAPIQVSVVTPGSVKSEIFRVAARDEGSSPEVAAFNQSLQRQAD
ncbi:SDR family NAD(P)-dependent oxidoreductase [Rhodococcus rhodnii]|uniref:Short chain dehydrogenase n=1 Tax=Rhodococcus rhodnii LMG 5362 TaxID=1273125 RepID=R7WR63_9NOCA|nr:SDR family NAD(P)-dependent oxidoreductase [Rhodococcus rhodnii]EOM77793.1 short chain dehydrogenase [Rhodococcus rhodnii LMG 5362]